MKGVGETLHSSMSERAPQRAAALPAPAASKKKPALGSAVAKHTATAHPAPAKAAAPVKSPAPVKDADWGKADPAKKPRPEEVIALDDKEFGKY